MNRKTKNNGRTRKVKAADRALLWGKTFKPSAQPPIISVAHWFPGTIVLRSTGDLEPTVNTWANEFRDTWGLNATGSSNRIPIALRFVRFSFWYFDVITPSPYQVLVRNLENWGEMMRLQDYPGRITWGRVGYEWPASQQFIQHDHDDSSNHPIKVDVTGSALWLCHMTVLWRPLNGTSYTEVMRSTRTTNSSPFSSLGADVQFAPRAAK